MEIKKFKDISIYKEEEEDKNFNRYFVNEISDVNTSTIRKIIYFEREKKYLIYINETFEEAAKRIFNQWNNVKNS